LKLKLNPNELPLPLLHILADFIKKFVEDKPKLITLAPDLLALLEPDQEDKTHLVLEVLEEILEAAMLQPHDLEMHETDYLFESSLSSIRYSDKFHISTYDFLFVFVIKYGTFILVRGQCYN